MTQASPSLYRPDKAEPSTKGLWWLVFASFAVLYLTTAQRSVSWQDSGMFQYRVVQGDYTGRLGLALAHPLYIGMGEALKYLPGDLLYKLNALSGLGMAIALANLAALCTVLTGRRNIGVVVAALVGLAHTPWWLATIAEIYTWVAAGLTGELWLLVSLLQRPTWKKLTGLALISGLGWGLHNFALLPLPVYLAVAAYLVATKRLPLAALAMAGLAYIVGAMPYLSMIVQMGFDVGWERAIRSALFGEFTSAVLNVGVFSQLWKVNAALSAMNFLSPLGPLAAIGLVAMRKLQRPIALALWAITAIELLFFVRYPVPDQFTFILPTLVMLAVAAGLGLDALARRSARAYAIVLGLCLLALAAQPVIYASAPAIAHRSGLMPQRARELPFRDEARYWLTPWKHNEQSAALFAASALAQAGPDGVIFPDSTSAYPLVLMQDVYGLAPEVRISFSQTSAPRPLTGMLERDIRQGRIRAYIVSPRQAGVQNLLPPCRFERREGETLYRLACPEPPTSTRPASGPGKDAAEPAEAN